MEETGLENMTENTEKEKVLSKEAIVAALNETFSGETETSVSGEGCNRRAWRIGVKRGICTCKNRSRPSASD